MTDHPQRQASQHLLQSKLIVLAILFTTTGFLGLPLLWVNRRFNAAERVIWSVVVTLYTVALIIGVVAICVWSLRRITPG